MTRGRPCRWRKGAFRRHVEWLASGAVRVVDLSALSGLDASEEAVALTFDDGFANFADRAWPLLRDRGLPVTVFVVTDRVGETNAWGGRDEPGIPTLPLLSWDGLAALAAEGVTLGAHSRTHRDLRSLEGGALEDEVAGAGERIEKNTGRRPDTFAYPYGHWSPAAVAAVVRSYRAACTTEHRVFGQREDPSRLPRLDTYYFRRGGLEGWGSAGFRTRVGIRRALRRMRALAATGHAA